MRIVIELYDRDPRGGRLGGSRVYMGGCHALHTSGDGLRLANLRPLLQRFYHAVTAALLQKDPESPEVDKVDKGLFPVIHANLERFLACPKEGYRSVCFD